MSRLRIREERGTERRGGWRPAVGSPPEKDSVWPIRWRSRAGRKHPSMIAGNLEGGMADDSPERDLKPTAFWDCSPG